MTDRSHRLAAQAVLQVGGFRTRFYETLLNRLDRMFAFVPAGARNAVVESLRPRVEEQYPWPEIESIAIDVYCKYLSEDELYALGQLLKTAIGQRWLELQDKVSAEILQNLQDWQAKREESEGTAFE